MRAFACQGLRSLHSPAQANDHRVPQMRMTEQSTGTSSAQRPNASIITPGFHSIHGLEASTPPFFSRKGPARLFRNGRKGTSFIGHTRANTTDQLPRSPHQPRGLARTSLSRPYRWVNSAIGEDWQACVCTGITTYRMIHTSLPPFNRSALSHFLCSSPPSPTRPSCIRHSQWCSAQRRTVV